MMQKNNNKYIDGVSVVIVTYNGSGRLTPTLTHLAVQKNIDFNFEIILVDNNSSDNTSKKAEQLWSDLNAPFPLKIVNELQPGTMYARERGINESKYRYMLYCDDDNWLCEDYVAIAYNTITKHEQIAAVGGKGIITYEKGFNVPKWMENYEHNFGTGAQGKKDGDTTDDKGCLYTAGTILDLKWLDQLYALGFESTLKGRDGKTLVAGEDTELTLAIKLIGGKLYYSSKMTFKHYMPSSRINWVYLKKLWFGFGLADIIISPYYNYFYSKSNSSKLLLLLSSFKALIKSYLKKSKGNHNELIYYKKKGNFIAILYHFNKYKKCMTNIATLTKNKVKNDSH